MARSRSTKRPAGARATRGPDVLAELKGLLLAKRAQLVAKLREEREGRIEATAQREKIEGTPFGDRPALSPDDEMGFAVADRRAGMLAQIDLALKKMEEGSYGRCEVCEEEIAPARLRAHPFAVRCTRCQEAWERDQLRGETGAVRVARAAADDTT
jgi:DnaK suppressor protein